MIIVKIIVVREKIVYEIIRYCKGFIKNVRLKVCDEKYGKI